MSNLQVYETKSNAILWPVPPLLVLGTMLSLTACAGTTPRLDKTQSAPIILNACIENSEDPELIWSEDLKGCDVLSPDTARQILIHNDATTH